MALLALALAGCAPQAAAPQPTPTPIAPDARLAGQSVYVTVGLGAGVTSPGLVEALDAQTGKLQWKASQSATAGPPVLAHGTLYVGSDEGTVRAYDPATGKQKWSFTRTQGVGQLLGLDGYVVVSGDTVVVTCDSGAIYGLDATTGAQRWVYVLTAFSSHIWTIPVTANGVVYATAGGPQGAIYALNATTGEVLWTLPQPGGFDGQPVVVGDTLYAGANLSPTFSAVNARTGATLWSYDNVNVAGVRSLAAVGPQMIYLGAEDSTIYALRASDRSLAWKFQTGGAAPVAGIATGAAPLLDGQTLYAGSEGGDVYALDATTGKQRWKVALNSAIDSPPALVDGTLFVTTEGGDVVALRASDGARIWGTKTGGYNYASPLVATPSGS